jgi:hypothetical protein
MSEHDSHATDAGSRCPVCRNKDAMNETERDMSDALKIIPNPHIAANMSDTEMLDWITLHKAQVWHDKRGNWTCQVCLNPGVVQPTRATLRAAIQDCADDLLGKLGDPT